MKDTLREELRAELQEFSKRTEKFMNKDISVKEYKGYSGGFGCYAQRGGEAFMLRLRMNQGIISKDKLSFICETCEEHHVLRAHFTTCQTVQLHDVAGSALPHIMSDALDHDIITRGGGGDYPRNVMCSPLSGVDPEESFDVRPYAAVVGEYLLAIIHTFQLPRKLKIACSNSTRNETHATFRDLGFVANHDHTFDVYCAGGLGNNPRMGVLVGSHVACEDILYYVRAMVSLFMKHGNYDNRAKARTRYMQETLGIEGLQQAFQTCLTIAQNDPSLCINVSQSQLLKKGNEELLDPRAFPQKQPGLYSIYYHPIGGSFPIEQLRNIYQVIKDMEDVELRITPQQGVYIINCTAEEGKRVLAITKDSAQSEFEESVACIGASVCQVGLRDSQHVLNELIQTLRKKNYPNHTLPRIFISGCTSSCGTNQIGRIGFQGSVKLIDKIAHPAFTLSLYGDDTLTKERFGDVVGTLLERDVLRFLTAVGDHVQHHHCDYATWLTQYPEELQRILQEIL